MKWTSFRVSDCGSHHLDGTGQQAYADRFDHVMKFHAPGLAPVWSKSEAWHIHPDGKPAYPRRFQRTFGYYDSLAAVISPDGWHHITTAGEDAYDARYDWCGNFQEEMCTVRERDGLYCHIKKNGQYAYEKKWNYAGDYKDGFAVVQNSEGHSTHIDSHGNVLHDCWFWDLDVFHKGFARARDTEGWMHIDCKGYPAYSRRFAAVEPFYNGQARVERFDGAREVIDESGKMIVLLRSPLDALKIRCTHRVKI